MPENGSDNPSSLFALLRPIERIKINQQILSRLKVFLDQKHLKMGSKLPSERQLAAMLEVSRPSIREVLRALSILGVVKSKQGDGTYLASSLRKFLGRPDEILTVQESLDLVELAEARSAIEPFVASLTAERASKEDLQAIGEHLEGMRRSLRNRAQFLHHDLEFHLRIMEGCGNDVLKRMMSVVLQNLFDHRAQVAQHYDDMGGVLALHEDIFEALRRHDPRLTRSAMVRHLAVTRKDSARLASSKRSHTTPPLSRGGDPNRRRLPFPSGGAGSSIHKTQS